MRSRSGISSTIFLVGIMLFGIMLFAILLPSHGTAKEKQKSDVTPPRVVYAPDPDYTEAARQDKVQGTVLVRLILDTDGTPHDMKVVRGLRRDLDINAVEAVAKWRFKPAMKDGKPITVQMNVEVSFRLY